MKIPNSLNAKIGDTYLQQARAAQRKGGNTTRSTSKSQNAKKDEIVLSPRATEIRELEEATKAVPEVRQEEVETVKRQIEANTYNVKGKLVAQNIADLLGTSRGSIL